jgi:hypothetical protein
MTCPWPILINSLPKSGTHLVARAVSMLLGLPEQGGAIDRLSLSRFTHPGMDGPTCLIGVASPRRVPLAALELALREVEPGRYVHAHLPYQPAVAAIAVEMQMKCLLVLRDPRDVVVSQSFYAINRPAHRLHRLYLEMNPQQRLMTSIRGLAPFGEDNAPLVDIGQRVRSVLEWQPLPGAHVLRFEQLVGSAGGGCDLEQRRALVALAQQLGLQPLAASVDRIAGQLFGNTPTFREGRIGSWREHFRPGHVAAFKEVAGQVLIELGYEQSSDW